MNEICYPSVDTWFLLYDIAGASPYAYGLVTPIECMKSARLVLETFLSEEALYLRMDELGYYHEPPID